MKKRKTYEISVIDKTYSKTISDENKFYTSDTALELGFELKETEYTFESAEIVLLNIDDRSLVTRPVSKVNNDFVYELDDDIIPYYGEWHGQLRFEAGEIYVSSPVKFRIENDLSNERPPQLSDVQSWVSLKRYADGLVDELKQAVLSVEGIEDTFNVNELERQNQFSSAEQSRQTTFEMAESERDVTFNTNEDIRQTQELEREKAETARQVVFDGNEANRAETFNTNEATRQENETTRQQAESQRQSTFEANETERQSTFEANETERQTTFETAEQERVSAELIRVSAEEERKTDHANRSAELAGKADKIVIKNLIENGDFSDSLTSWIVDGGTATVINGIASFKMATKRVTSKIYQNIATTLGNKYYISSTISPTNFTAPLRVHFGIADNYSNSVKLIPDPVSGSIYKVSEVVTGVLTTSSLDIKVDSSYFVDGEWILTVYNSIVIDLTKTFGAGNEPTKTEMDELIKVTGYIDGEYALNNKEMLIWTLALVRRNKNAIVALGGA